MANTVERGLVAEVLQRGSDSDRYARWAEQAAGTGYCRHPIRLSGRLDAVRTDTGEMTPQLDTSTEPDGVLLVACENRRATVCPSCAATYRADAWQLLAAGLRGGKGVPQAVAAHPRLFLTLTAPSFGPVHSRRQDRRGRARRCHPRPDDFGLCPHGRPSTCTARHGDHDPVLGQPLCPDCFDYEAAVLFNAHVTALWQHTILLTRRAFAAELGVPVRHVGRLVRLSFGKVAEYQARGVIHLHVIVRLDGPGPGLAPPPETLTAQQLRNIVTSAARRANAVVPADLRRLTWGTQVDVHPIPTSPDGSTHTLVEVVAGYLAKYATKSTDAAGALDRPIRSSADIDALRVNPHLRRLAATCWQLGADYRYERLRLRAWAHTLGFRGHLTTKSRGYSTTFGALRNERHDHARTKQGADTTELVGSLRYAGRGYSSFGDAWLAETARRHRQEARRLAALDRKRAVAPPAGHEVYR